MLVSLRIIRFVYFRTRTKYILLLHFLISISFCSPPHQQTILEVSGHFRYFGTTNYRVHSYYNNTQQFVFLIGFPVTYRQFRYFSDVNVRAINIVIWIIISTAIIANRFTVEILNLNVFIHNILYYVGAY